MDHFEFTHLTAEDDPALAEETPLNTPPEARDDVFVVVPTRATELPLLENDVDADGDGLTVSAFEAEFAAIIFSDYSRSTINGEEVVTGSFTITVPLGFVEGDLEYTVSDGDGGFDTATVTVRVERLTEAQAQTVALLYEAGLNRDGNIDLPGLNFWIDQREAGLSERQLSRAFLESNEFTAAFGEAFDTGAPDYLSNQALVEQLYRNVLNREGETAGVDFWTGLVASPEFTRADLLLAFAGSPENVAGSPFVEDLAETAPGAWEFLTL